MQLDHKLSRDYAWMSQASYLDFQAVGEQEFEKILKDEKIPQMHF